ncbi:FAD-dependent oxidoreductase [Nocardia sp. NBC_01730]|uniref:NAD(P)/FAD-dependent oxidoreductase n=1 Tax=Nocardia sp. NBC_01730 TaxID=2975998 RepID=UPI002E1593E6|nr:FAD-dependent oxidoreductase [Nocardia sp. NBC_01730]
MTHIAVVGASLAGLRAAETLRAEGFDGELTIIGDEPHLPYDRPPLSKDFLLGKVEIADIALADSASHDYLDARWVLGSGATRLRPGQVTIGDGEALATDGIVLATGARARRIPKGDRLTGIRVLRTLDDAVALRQSLESAQRVVIVGAGFIGAEVASTAAALGKQVTIVEAARQPFQAHLGRVASDLLRRTINDHNVELRTGHTVSEFDGAQRVSAVVLDDGTRLPADLVLVGIGAIPNTEWLAGSGVLCDNGVLTDAWGRTNVAGIVAAGDVARFQRGDRQIRVEHWTSASGMAATAARALLAHLTGVAPGAPHLDAPYFWSEQFGHRIQMVGRLQPDLSVDIVEGAVDNRRFVAVQRSADAVTAVLGWSMPREFTQWRRRNTDSLREAAH